MNNSRSASASNPGAFTSPHQANSKTSVHTDGSSATPQSSIIIPNPVHINRVYSEIVKKNRGLTFNAGIDREFGFIVNGIIPECAVFPIHKNTPIYIRCTDIMRIDHVEFTHLETGNVAWVRPNYDSSSCQLPNPNIFKSGINAGILKLHLKYVLNEKYRHTGILINQKATVFTYKIVSLDG